MSLPNSIAYVAPAMAAPTSGAAQNAYSCTRASLPANRAGPVDRETFTERRRRVEMATADVSDGIGHGEHREAEREGHAQEPDADIGHTGGQHSRAAPTEHQHEGAEELRGDALRQ